ncbi:MAG: branched-chain amino acid aminotransferase [Cyclobacteriaceae bacterium]
MTDTIDITINEISESRISEFDQDNLVFGKTYSDHMFVADYVDGEWKDFRIEPYGNLNISPANSALHYGQSIFEGLKAHKSPEGDVLVFRPERNAARLNRSAERMCIPELPEEIFMQGLHELLKLDKNWVPDRPGTSLYIRPFIFAMDPYIGIKPSETYKFMIFTAPVGAYYSEPVRVKIETEYTRASEGGTGAAKTAGNYAAALYPAVQNQKNGYHQLIWTDGKTHEYIEESGTMNVLFYINDTLLTAPTGDTILNGITRDSVLTLAREWGLNVEERPIKVEEIVNAAKNGTLKEAFGAGTAATIAHIKTIGHNGVDYDLPAIDENSLGARLMKELSAIKTGETSDKHNWIFKI